MTMRKTSLLCMVGILAWTAMVLLNPSAASAEKVYELVEAHTGTKANTTYWAAKEFEQRVEKYSNGRIKVSVHPAGGERSVMNSERLVKTPAEAKGMKLRVVASPINQHLIRAWGFNPVSIPWSETYQAVQQGIVKGVYLPDMWAYISKIYEVATKVTETGGIGIWHVVVMNRKLYDGMPKDLQAAIDRAASEANIACYEHDQYWAKKAKEAMIKSGCEFYTPTLEESKQWIAKAKATWGPMIEKLKIDKSFVEMIQKAQIPVDKY